MTGEPLDYSSPVPFRFSQRCVLAVLPPIAVALLRIAGGLNRVEMRRREFLDEMVAQHGSAIVGFWHESLALAAYCHRGSGYHTLTSYSFDGELAARMVYWCGMRAVRGSSSRGGYQALKNMAKALQIAPSIGFTLDGPKGPRRVAKPGIVILAAKMGVPIIPHALVATRVRRMRSWDRLMVPLPFGAIVTAYGEPVPPPTSVRAAAVEESRLLLEQRLNALYDELERAHGIDPELKAPHPPDHETP